MNKDMAPLHRLMIATTPQNVNEAMRDVDSEVCPMQMAI